MQDSYCLATENGSHGTLQLASLGLHLCAFCPDSLLRASLQHEKSYPPVQGSVTGSSLRVGELRNRTQHLVYCSCHFWQYISHDHAQLYQASGLTFMLLRVVWCICPPKSTTSCWDGYRGITTVRPTREKWTYLPPVLWFPNNYDAQDGGIFGVPETRNTQMPCSPHCRYVS